MQHSVEAELNGKQFKIESGLLAKQANGSVLASYADTMVLITVVCGNIAENASGDEGFLPLTVDYREKSSAAGKFPGGFFKREGRPTVKEILASRLIDRPLRPLFLEGFTNEIQIIATVLSADQENDSDIVAMNGASAALMVSDIPFNKPVGSVRIGLIDDKFILNPTYSEIEKSAINLVVSGTKDGIIMVEGDAKEIPEEKMLEAIIYAHIYIKQLVELQLKLRELCKKPLIQYKLKTLSDSFYESIKQKYIKDLKSVFFTPGKKNRNNAMKTVFEKMVNEICQKDKNGNTVEGTPTESEVRRAYDRMESELVRTFAIEGKRADGRGSKNIRQITIQLGVLPRTHGSALFTRGETQALVTITLGTKQDEQIIDGLVEEYSKRFMLHYNFTPFSTGEVKPLRGPGRREIGHGTLAERALEPVIPSKEEFPYTIRVISDILESNGSTSMASVCGGTLALMDAGVKIKAPVAGIAMGLIKENDKFCILSDILGSEDAHGDMDFKVAGTEEGVTALQMDLKTDGITFDIMRIALLEAREGRQFILEKMKEAIVEPRKDISEYAPQIMRIAINQSKIGLLIGPGGRTVRDIQTKTGVTIEISDDGTVNISSKDAQTLQVAKEMVEAITEELKVGKIYRAKVVSIKDFGAFVQIQPSEHEGLLHISELADTFVQRVEDHVKLGQEISVKVISLDEQGRPRFSLKQARNATDLPIANI